MGRLGIVEHQRHLCVRPSIVAQNRSTARRRNIGSRVPAGYVLDSPQGSVVVLDRVDFVVARAPGQPGHHHDHDDHSYRYQDDHHPDYSTRTDSACAGTGPGCGCEAR